MLAGKWIGNARSASNPWLRPGILACVASAASRYLIRYLGLAFTPTDGEIVRAYVDESQPGGTGSGGPYLLAATMLPAHVNGDEVRDQLRALLPRHQRKLHWGESVVAQRRRVIDVIASLELVHWVVVRPAAIGERPERARRTCLEKMLWELDQLDVTEVVFESRGRADDRRDVEMVGKLRARRYVSAGLRVDHVRGLPDAVCGAVGAALRGDRSHADRLVHQTWTVAG